MTLKEKYERCLQDSENFITGEKENVTPSYLAGKVLANFFNNERIGDGDLLWNDFSEKDYTTASLNIKKMFDLSEEKGIILTGGASLTLDLYNTLKKEIDIPIFLSENPTIDTIKGIEIVMNS